MLFKVLFINNFIMNRIYKYLNISGLINACYSTYDSYDIKIKRNNELSSHLLPSERIQLFIVSYLLGHINLPIKIINNIDYKVIKDRNENPENYGYTKIETFQELLYKVF